MKIAITRSDGGLSLIVDPPQDVEGYIRSWEDSSHTDPAKRFKCVRWRFIQDNAHPSDRQFREAWTDTGTTVAVDMPKARTIHLDRIRAARKPELERLDAEWMKATGQKRTADADTIEAQRQVLRDLPQTLPVDQCRTPEELTALWPAELPRP